MQAAFVGKSMCQLKYVFHQETGLHIKGPAKSLNIMSKYRVCLAPLRFGAGLKGKIVDSWGHGLPVVSTPIGAEGMTGLSHWEESLDSKICLGVLSMTKRLKLFAA